MTKSSRWGLLFALTALVGFIGNLFLQSINLALLQSGASGIAIGVSTAMQAFGIVIAAAVAPRLLVRFGSAAMVMRACALGSVALLICCFGENVATVTICRFVVGMALGTLVTVVEYILTARTPVQSRTLTISGYALSFTLGCGLASGLLSLGTIDLHTANMLGIAGLILASTLVSSARICRRVEDEVQTGLWQAFRFAPAAFVGAFVFGVLDNGLLSLFGTFGGAGVDATNSNLVVSAAFFGMLLFQIPAGLIAGRIGNTNLLVACTTAVGAILVALATGIHNFYAIVGAAFLLGGLCESLYIVALIYLASNVPKPNLAAANACFVGLCGSGEIVGPLLAGSGAQLNGTTGFFLIFAIFVIVYLFMLMKNDAGGPEAVIEKPQGKVYATPSV